MRPPHCIAAKAVLAFWKSMHINFASNDFQAVSSETDDDDDGVSSTRPLQESQSCRHASVKEARVEKGYIQELNHRKNLYTSYSLPLHDLANQSIFLRRTLR